MRFSRGPEQGQPTGGFKEGLVIFAVVGGLGLAALSQIDGKPSEPRADDSGDSPTASAPMTPGEGLEASGADGKADQLLPLPDPDEHDGTTRTFGFTVDTKTGDKTLVIPCGVTDRYPLLRHNREQHRNKARVAFSGADFGTFAVDSDGSLSSFTIGRPAVELDDLEPGVIGVVRDPEAPDDTTQVTLFDTNTGQKATIDIRTYNKDDADTQYDARCTTPRGVGKTYEELLASIPN